MESLIVRDYMDIRPVTFSKTLSLSAAFNKVMNSEHMGGPVINEQNEVIGFISEQDMLQTLIKVSYQCQDTHTVEDCMRIDPLTVSPNLSIIELAAMMQENKPKTYPVVEDNRLVGIIQRKDVLKAIQAHLNLCFSKPI